MSGNRLAAMSDSNNDSSGSGINNEFDDDNYIDENTQEVVVASRPNDEVSMHLDNNNNNSNSNSNTNTTNDPLSMTIGNTSSRPMMSDLNEMDDWEANSTFNTTAERSFSRQATISLDERSSVPQEQSTSRHSHHHHHRDLEQEREREELLEQEAYFLHHLQENYLEMMQTRHNAPSNTDNDVSSVNTNNNSERFHELLSLQLRGRNLNIFMDNESVEAPLDSTRDPNTNTNSNSNNSNNKKSLSERQRTREILHNRPRLTVHSVPLIMQAPVLQHKSWNVPLFSMRLLCPCLAGESRRLFLEISKPSPLASNSCDEMENTESSDLSSALESQSNSLSFESSTKLRGHAGKSQLHHRHKGKASHIKESRLQQSQNNNSNSNNNNNNNNQNSNSHRDTSQTSSVPYGESVDEISTMQGEAQLNSLHTNNNNNNIAEIRNSQNVEIQQTNEMPSPVRSLNPLSTPARIQQQEQQQRIENQQNGNNNGRTRRNKPIAHLEFHHTNSQHVSVYIPKLSAYNDVFNNTIMLDVFDNIVRSKRSSLWDYCGHALYRYFCGRCTLAHQTQLLFIEEAQRGRMPYRVCCEDCLFGQEGNVTRSVLTMLLLDTLSCGILNCCCGVGYAGIGTALFEWRLRYLLRCRYGIHGTSFSDMCVGCWLPTAAIVQQSAELAAHGMVEHGPCSVVLMVEARYYE